MVDQKLSIKQKQQMQLCMLDEIDKVCKENNLKYSLAYGTLLGAVRHKGFIPWDDDVDIFMPLDDMLKLKHILQSDNIEFIDIDSYKNYDWFFPRIASKRTYSKPGKTCLSYGVNIDLYPIVGLPASDEEIQAYLKKGTKLANKVNFLVRWKNSIILRLPFNTILGLHTAVLNARNFALQYPYNNSLKHFSVGGSFGDHNLIEFDIFSSLIDIDFEGHKYKAIEGYDKFLSKVYGDYMTPPPIDKRIPYHGGSYYWKY